MDPISPELVLVDPELARVARAQLPAASNGRVTPAPAIARAPTRRQIVGAGAVPHRVLPAIPPPLVRLPEPAAAEAGAAEAEPRRAVGKRRRLVAASLFGFLLGILIQAMIAGGDVNPLGQPRASGDEQPETVTPHSVTSARSSFGSPPRADRAQTQSRPGARRAGRAGATQEERPRRRKASEAGLSPQTPQPAGRAAENQTNKPRPRKASEAALSPQTPRRRAARAPIQGRVATRLFVWLPSRGASYYHVQFLKGRRTIFEAWPTDPRVTVPLRGTFRGRKFAFTNGRYRWIVRPASGPRSARRYGEPIVRSIWVARP
jgi:hypothetical protein